MSGIAPEKKARDDHNRMSSDTILQRASRCAYVLSRAATPNYLSVCIGRILREKFAPISEVPCRKFFENFSSGS